MGSSNEIRNTLPSLSNVLFAMDFSHASLRAYPYAAEIAQHYGGKVWVSHIVPSGDGDRVPSSDQVRLDKLLEVAAEAGLSGALGVLGLVPHEVLIDHGNICAKLLATADKCKVDLIVIGTHGLRGVRKLLKGSFADEIAYLANRPVLIVGPKVSRQLRFKRILYATDFRPTATNTFQYAVSLTQSTPLIC